MVRNVVVQAVRRSLGLFYRLRFGISGPYVVIGRHCNIRRNNLTVESGVFIGPGSWIRVPTSIGRYSMLAGSVSIVGDDHPIDIPGVPAAMGGAPARRAVTIGRDVWIGRGATILSGVTVGDGAIVGAGSLVADDVPPLAIVVGPKAKHLRNRFEGTDAAKHLAVLRGERKPAER